MEDLQLFYGQERISNSSMVKKGQFFPSMAKEWSLALDKDDLKVFCEDNLRVVVE